MGSNPTQGMMFGVYVFILCLCCPVFGQRPCDGPITRSSPTVCKKDHETEKETGPTGVVEPVEKKLFFDVER
jgi:hypothetical protein